MIDNTQITYNIHEKYMEFWGIVRLRAAPPISCPEKKISLPAQTRDKAQTLMAEVILTKKDSHQEQSRHEST